MVSSATQRTILAQPTFSLDLATKAGQRPEETGGSRSVYARGKGMIAAWTSPTTSPMTIAHTMMASV